MHPNFFSKRKVVDLIAGANGAVIFFKMNVAAASVEGY